MWGQITLLFCLNLWGNLKKGPKDKFYVPTLWGGGGFEACPADVPGIGEPEVKELCAGPAAALGFDNKPVRCGTVLPGGLQLEPPVIARCSTNKQTNDMW
jgi:hypothetical protein